MLDRITCMRVRCDGPGCPRTFVFRGETAAIRDRAHDDLRRAGWAVEVSEDGDRFIHRCPDHLATPADRLTALPPEDC